jgi:hypothetical protein
MFKRKVASVILLLALAVTALGLRAATISAVDSAYTTHSVPADPIPLPINPPPK